MLELFGVALDAVGFGLGLLAPFVIAWAWEKRRDYRRSRRRRDVIRERGVENI